MSMAKQCDRCHKLFMPHHTIMKKKSIKANGFVAIDRNDDNSNYYTREYVDLCPDCFRSFVFWLNMFTEEENDG